ncbi:MAG: GNAT family N-acetyltransferase, partial [Candidatus Velamenicoccus archaeovorus]
MRATGALVTLRPFRADELDAVVAARRRQDGLVPDRSGVSEESLRRRVASSGTMTRHELFLAIEAEGRLVGEVQARRSAEVMPQGVFELGIEIYEEADRGRGFGSDAVSAITSHLFEREGAHRVQASTDVENAPMRRVLERLGFGFEGILRGFLRTPAGLRDHAMYAVGASGWRSGGERSRGEEA